MNILHLKYAVEVEKTGSITKAADNLFMSQPNLSKAVRELEETLGITIFKRTSKGMIPTQRGVEFLNYANNILSQIDEIENLYSKDREEKLTFNISIPRASYITHAFTRLVSSLDLKKEIEFNYKETNSVRAISNIMQSNYNMGIIRYQTDLEDYYLGLLKEKELRHEVIWEFDYLALMSKNHILANKEKITFADLGNFIEIAHGDLSIPSMPFSEVKKMEQSEYVSKKRIYVYERGSQFDLLCDVPTTYMWVSPIPKKLLERFNLVERKCVDACRKHKDVLIYKQNHKLSEIEERFIWEIEKAKDEVMQDVII
jgi:DNA-binding transcriptional LysR family regulator